ncbi:hypothetical protein SAMN02745196_01709 [Clostridium collagenovorans DSM 3089]|uniref:DUF4352 domain-containing protein n=1 Tax=Clostridium collagenovorans DSM 3089 TaxID=1121306 RepID=A0A1M5WL27_9CLOT|nr:hypothetical protein [Clostridium collagenovorans]SHH88138.1 hypothetical protein SAMN02745196_01709 [Clostridium collagenovorans DSM 3089]
MKSKKIVSLLLTSVVATSILFTGCSDKPAEKSNEKKTEQGSAEKKKEEPVKKQEEVKANLNEKLTEDGKFEITVESTEFAPKLTINEVEHKAKAKGKTLLHVVSNVKNLGEKNTVDKVVTINGRYDSKYEAMGTPVIEGREKGDLQLDKDAQDKVHYLIEVDEEIATDATPMELMISSGKDSKILTISVSK